MKAYVLDAIRTLRAHLGRESILYEPRDVEGEVRWTRIDPKTSDEAAFGGKATLAQFGPKQLFFAEREPLFRFDGKCFVQTLPEVAPSVLLGVRACELVAIAYQDRFFARDPHYARRRAATLLVGLDCNEPCERGFCHLVDSGPAVRAGTADLVLGRGARDASWTLLVATEAGDRALEGLRLPAAAHDWRERRNAREHSAIGAFPPAGGLREGIRRVRGREVGAETWEEIGLQCLGCSGCTAVCPTCSCYATTDEADAAGSSAATHTRFWDSCLYEGFQREASGHHPAPSPGQRVERFWTHKLSEDFTRKLGRDGCVGCGRCEQACPGSIGARAVLTRIACA